MTQMLRPDQAAAIEALNVLRAALLSSAAPDQPAPALKSQPAAAPAATSPPDLTRLPEFAVVGRELASVILGISLETLKRMEARGQGPKRIKVSQKRTGYRLSDLRLWVESRTT
jgi:predicted DNA-binding transcriptional regulator AlpA